MLQNKVRHIRIRLCTSEERFKVAGVQTSLRAPTLNELRESRNEN